MALLNDFSIFFKQLFVKSITSENSLSLWDSENGWILCFVTDMSSLTRLFSAFRHDISVIIDFPLQTPIAFKGKTYQYVPGGRRGYHQLAAALLNGGLSYPSFAVLDENLTTIDVIKGIKRRRLLRGLWKRLLCKRGMVGWFDCWMAKLSTSH